MLAHDLVRSLLSVLFPSRCLLCGNELIGLVWTGTCPTCWRSMNPWTGPVCLGCGLPFEPATRAYGEADRLCSRCSDREYRFDHARSYGLYYGRLRAAILALKFQGRDRLAPRLGAMLATVASLTADLDASQATDRHEPAAPRDPATQAPLIVPVPLHPSRRRERGFNQAELLARAMVRAWCLQPQAGPGAGPEFRLKVAGGCLVRHRSTDSQAGLSLEDRLENVHEAFRVRRPEPLLGRRVILVDDVMTTGATASACAAALKGAGAAQVLVVTLARATVDSV